MNFVFPHLNDLCPRFDCTLARLRGGGACLAIGGAVGVETEVANGARRGRT